MNKALRQFKARLQAHNIDAYIIFNNDPHLNEYLPEHWKIIPYLSDFTGSAATLVITNGICGLWTDSRYFIQAEKELKNKEIRLYKQNHEDTPSIHDFLASTLKRRQRVGINSLCCSIEDFRKLQGTLAPHNIILKDIDLTVEINKILPPLASGKIFHHPLQYSGETFQSKLFRLRKILVKNKATHIFLSSLDDIAWLFNLRGSDIACNPVFYSYALLSLQETTLFIDKNKIPDDLYPYFKENDIILKDYKATFDTLPKAKDATIWLDNAKATYRVFSLLKEHKINLKENPVQLLKSIKNNEEVAGMQKSSLCDSIALVHFWYWLENNFQQGVLTEYDIVLKLREFRSRQSGYLYDSFEAIVGFNENGAIVHYKPEKETAKPIAEGILLIDSGGQYEYGTTDITRTFLLGRRVSKSIRRDYTLVLKGLINLSLAIFPKGTHGCNLDVLARKPMWRHGVNYGHGTGHGVGAFLNVHEGPQRLRQELYYQPIMAGMISSNEPGIYRVGKYGIRLENLILCKTYKNTDFGEFLCFETLTLFPFDKKLIMSELLSTEELRWLTTYHEKTYNAISPQLPTELQNWLADKCQMDTG